MLTVGLLALAMLGARGDDQISVRTVHSGAWTAQVQTDRFTGEISCRLRGPRMSFHRDTVVFELGRHVDTAQAFFRLDAGPARSVREPRLQNETHGFFLDSGPVDNPSGGRVALPYSLVQSAKSVLVRANPRRDPRAFDVSGLADALAAAKAAGCKDESF
jgi:hypothetical protein